VVADVVGGGHGITYYCIYFSHIIMMFVQLPDGRHHCFQYTNKLLGGDKSPDVLFFGPFQFSVTQICFARFCLAFALNYKAWTIINWLHLLIKKVIWIPYRSGKNQK
jgi:hypothetical protein